MVLLLQIVLASVAVQLLQMSAVFALETTVLVLIVMVFQMAMLL